MKKQMNINWSRPVSESLEAIKEIIKEVKSFEKRSFGIHRIPIKDEYGETLEVLVIRGLITEHQISTAKAETMILSLTMKIGENKETFIFTARDFKKFIELNYHNSFEIIFIERKGYLRIEKSF